MTKRDRKKEEILKTALNVWRNKAPGERTLQLVAEQCGMTKQGLYRYFRNKQEMMDTLHSRWNDAVILNRNQILNLSRIKPLPLGQIIEETLSFYIENWEYIVFYFHTHTFQSEEALKEANEYYCQLEKNSAVSCREWIWINNNIMALHWQYHQNDRDLDHLSDKIQKKVTQGYLSGVQVESIQRQMVENHPLGLVQGEKGIGKIDQALLDTIAEKGISELSLRELAEQAGMGKSSLYNYFDSKEELLHSVMETLRIDFKEGIKAFAEALESPCERLFGHILFLCRYIQHHPAVMVLVTELKNQMPVRREENCEKEQELLDMAAPFLNLKKAGLLEEDILDYLGLMRLLSFCLGADMFLVHLGESPEERAFHIYRLFTQGISLNGSVENREDE